MTLTQSLHLQMKQKIQRSMIALSSLALSLLIPGCANVITTRYEATALVTYTWQVQYNSNPDKPIRDRREKFASTSLLNRNGERPDDAVTGPDDKGLWWPALPPRPTVDEIEAEKRSGDEVEQPQLIKSVDYNITYEDEGREVTLPTNYSVYRQVVKAYPEQKPLELTIAGDENFVTKADPR